MKHAIKENKIQTCRRCGQSYIANKDDIGLCESCILRSAIDQFMTAVAKQLKIDKILDYLVQKRNDTGTLE